MQPSTQLNITTLDHEAAAALLADHAASQEWWLIICDGPGFRSLEPILRRFYGTGDDQDLFATVSSSDDLTLAVVVARRRRMDAGKFRFELGKIGITTSARELAEAAAFIHVADFNRKKAREFVRAIGIQTEGAEMAMEE